MAAHLTDEEIHNYFKPGKVFNIGSAEDNVQAVISCEIIKPLKGLIVEVYKSFQRDGKISDCTNNGITSRVNQITLVGEEYRKFLKPQTMHQLLKLSGG